MKEIIGYIIIMGIALFLIRWLDIGKSIDQELGIYKQHHTEGRSK